MSLEASAENSKGHRYGEAPLVPPVGPDRNRTGTPHETVGSLRILQVVEATDYGVGRHVLDLCGGLAALGHDVHLVYSPIRSGPLFSDRLNNLKGVRQTVLPMQRQIHFSDWRSVRRLRRHLRQHGPFQIVHGHSSKGGALARLATLGLPLPAVYTPHAVRSLDPTLGTLLRFVTGKAERLLALVPGAVVALSPEEQQHFWQLGVSERQVRLIPNGVPQPPVPDRRSARAALGLPASARVVGFVGRLTKQKAPEVLLDAFVRVQATRPDVHLAIIGTGELQSWLEQRAGERNVAHCVHWLGQQPGQASMPAFDLLALPSRYEGLPYVLLEALVAGLPIVTTSAACASTIVEPGVNGSVVPHDAPEELAAAIADLLDQPQLRATYGAASQDKAYRFRIDTMVQETETLYRELAARWLPDRRSNSHPETPLRPGMKPT